MDKSTIRITVPRPKRRAGVIPTKVERSGKDRSRQRNPKHKGKEPAREEV